MKPRIIPIVKATSASAAAAAAETSASLGLRQLPPLALYIHYPWCIRKCPYCDFNSHAVRQEIPEAAYIDALILDLEQALPEIWGRRIISVFIGGGTPSLLSAAALTRLLEALRARLPLLADAEITLEANPGTADAAHFAAYRAAGVNRLSLGIQSFNDRHLAALGRIHDAVQAQRAIELALTHFDKVNIDLMYALPGQELFEAEEDIRRALQHGVSHISAYHLSIEPNTAFFHAPPPLPDDDLAADMQEAVEAQLLAAGFLHYETAAFARTPAERCTHNLNYWTYGDYLGLGAGAHGKISSASDIVREVRRPHPRDYLAAAATGTKGDFLLERRSVAPAERPLEFMMNALRLTAGFDPALYAEHTGLLLAAINNSLQALQGEGLLTLGPEQIAPTARGRRFLNTLLERF